MPLTGQLFIGFARVSSPNTFRATKPAGGTLLVPPFSAAGRQDVEKACALAQASFDPYRQSAPALRARFLETCGEKILALGDALLARANAETGLPQARLESERARTVGQLRLFASVLRRGDYLGVR